MCVCVRARPRVGWTHATRARLSSCKSSPDIQAHGDLQYSAIDVCDSSALEGLTVILLIKLMSCVLASVCAHLLFCHTDFCGLICVYRKQNAAVYLLKRCILLNALFKPCGRLMVPASTINALHLPSSPLPPLSLSHSC